MTDDRFDPWAAAERRDDLILALHPVAALMGGGFHAWRGGVGVIVIDPGLGGPERRAVLTHELVHHERGGAVERAGAPAAWQALVDREERAVDREVARRLVPTPELDTFVAEGTASGAGIDAPEVAAHFDVPRWVAALALELHRPDQTRRPDQPGPSDPATGDYSDGPLRWSRSGRTIPSDPIGAPHD